MLETFSRTNRAFGMFHDLAFKYGREQVGVLAVLCSKPYEQVQHIPDGNRIALACAGDV